VYTFMSTMRQLEKLELETCFKDLGDGSKSWPKGL
jgi:hypothetical protein